jgi:hypothetical protein
VVQAGWNPDPTGEHEFRYHNGTEWTGDVATDGIRHVTAIPDLSTPRFPQRRDPRSGTVAMVFGILSMSIGWIPFVCFVALFFGGVGVVVGLRRRRFESARGSATVGIVTGFVGILLSFVGIWLSIVLVQTVADFEDPGPYRVELTDCSEVGGVTRATGEIANLDTDERTYTIEVSFDGETSGEAVIADVPAGEQRTFLIDENLRFDDLECEVLAVKGPRPFGIE